MNMSYTNEYIDPAATLGPEYWCLECRQCTSGRCWQHSSYTITYGMPFQLSPDPSKGWECPRCAKIYSPHVDECKSCNSIDLGSPKPAILR